MLRAIFALIVAAVLSLSGLANAKETKPLKVIAPDLVVESLEFGKFPSGHGPLDQGIKPSQYKFIPVASHVADQTGYGYGYRLRLKTARPRVRIFQSVDRPFHLNPLNPKKGEGNHVQPINGAIYEQWMLDGIRNGKYTVRLWIEDVELPKLVYTVNY